MKGKKILLLITVFVAFIVCSAFSPIDKYAPAREEVVLSDVVIMTENSPVTLKKQTVTFNYDSNENNGYSDSVAVESKYFNPTDEAITVKVAFPCGKFDGYAENIDKNSVTEVFVDGKAVEPEVRYTEFENYNTPVYSNEAFKIREKSSLIAGDATVNLCDFKFMSNKDFGYAACKVNFAENTRILVKNAYDIRYFSETSASFNCYPDSNNDERTCRILVIGDPNDVELDWLAYEDYSSGSGFDVKANLVSQRTMTFSEFLDENCLFDEHVNSIDRHNAFVDRWLFYGKTEIIGVPDRYANFTNSMIKWLVYDMEIPAKTEVVTTVSIPMPNNHYSSIALEFCFNSKTADENFEGLTLDVNTSYIMNSMVYEKNLQKTDSGYTVSFDEMKTGSMYLYGYNEQYGNEIYYDDCNCNGWSFVFSVMLTVFFVTAAVGIGLIVLAIIWLKKLNKK